MFDKLAELVAGPSLNVGCPEIDTARGEHLMRVNSPAKFEQFEKLLKRC